MQNDLLLDQVKALETQISTTKYNKATQHAIGLMKAQLSRLKEKMIMRSKKGPKTSGFAVRKTGDGTVVLVGFPSVGKSTLLNALTTANSKVAAYEFTTLDVVPGILEHKYAKIQILDVPGIVHGAAAGTGRGKEVLAVMRNADLILFLIDVMHPEHYEALKKEVFDSGIRINQRAPDVKIVRKSKGGIKIGKTVKLTWLDDETIADILREFRVSNADVVIREDITADQLIDVVEGHRAYMPSVTILNKIDLADENTLERVKKQIKPDMWISADKKVMTDTIKEIIYNGLNVVRVYCKEVGKEADLDIPMIMFKGATIEDMCNKLHKDFVKKFKFARLWGKSAKFPGQKKMLGHKLDDGDIVEIHVR
jgi:small GTP-binding protein